MEIQIEKEQISPVEIELKVTVPAELMVDRLETAFETVTKHAKVPGFRQGKIPRKVLIEKYGKTITNETVQEVLSEAYKQALEESELEPVSPGEMSDISFERGNPMTFSVKVEILPEVEILVMTDVTVELLQPQAEEEDLMTTLDSLRESHAVLVPTDDPVDADTVIIADFQELDGSGLPIIGRTQKDVEIDMRRNRFGEEFAAKVIGLKTGDTAVVVFENKAQQKANSEGFRVEVTIQNIQRKELPPLDDEFAKSVNEGMNSLDDLKNDLKRYIELRAQHQAREQMYKSMVDELLRKADFPVPPRMLDDYLDRMAEDATKNQSQKLEKERLEEFKTNYRASAIWSLRWYILRKKIVELNALEVSDDDYEAELERFAAMEDQPVQEIRKKLTHEQIHHIKDDLVERKVLKYLEDQIQTVPRPVALAEFEGRSPGKVIAE